MRNRLLLLTLAGVLASPIPLLAQATWHTAGVLGGALALSPASCSTTWYDPEAFFYPDGTRGFIAQGIQPNSCNQPFDALYRAKFNATTLTWQLPAPNSCPTLAGRQADFGCGETPSLAPNQPLASPAIAKVGSRYYMAFSGGNADLRKGHIFWAYSDDGVTWTTLKWDPKPAGFNWKPLIYPLYGGVCEHFGVAQLTLTYDPNSGGPNGAFYLHMQYLHRNTGAGDTYIFRIPFSSANGFGLGGPMQVCINGNPRGSTCTWTNHSGAMVFDYDGQPVVAGDPLLSPHQGNDQNFNAGAGSITWDPSHNYWLRVYTTITPYLYWQSSTSLASGVWTSPGIVDMSSFNSQVLAQYPSANLSGAAYGGLFWGTIGTRTGMWLFQPASYMGCPPFQGVGIFTVALNYN